MLGPFNGAGLKALRFEGAPLLTVSDFTRRASVPVSQAAAPQPDWVERNWGGGAPFQLQHHLGECTKKEKKGESAHSCLCEHAHIFV